MTTQDDVLQSLANTNPEAADNAMNALGYSSTPTKNDNFGQALLDRMMSMSPLVSSDNTSFETAISSSKQATEQGAQLIESKGSREISAAREKFGAERTTLLESGRGFMVNTAALRQLDESTDKSIKDMEARKDELILQNNIAGANRISDLQVKSEEFRQNARQQSFENIFKMGQFAIGLKAEERAAEQFKDTMSFQRETLKFNTENKMADIAAEWGVDILPGDTLASVVNKVKPFASAKRRGELAKLLKDTEVESDKVRSSTLLGDALTGTGVFSKEQGGTGVPLTPASAAQRVAIQLKSLGLKFSLPELEAEAEKLFAQNNENIARENAKEEGKQSSFFGGLIDRARAGMSMSTSKNVEEFKALREKGINMTSAERSRYVLLQKSMPDSVVFDSQTSAFTSLYQR